MFLVLNYYGVNYSGANVFDIAYVKDDDQQTLQDALDIIGGYHNLYLSDDKVYDVDEMNAEDFENKNFDDYDAIGSIDVYDEQFLTIDGEIQ